MKHHSRRYAKPLLCAVKLSNMYDKKQYEEDLKRRQEEHLKNIQRQQDINWRPCMHDNCPYCVGTGLKSDGSACIHYISCPCPKCSPQFVCSSVS